jgi:hypothetical protein
MLLGLLLVGYFQDLEF